MDVGPRKQQEDCLLIVRRVFQENQLIKEGTLSGKHLLLAVCDGMGGHEAGEKASQFVCRELKKSYRAGHFSHAVFEETLRSIQKKSEKMLPPKCGCTIAGLVVENQKVYIFNAGDSRVYKIMPETISYVSHDHSAVQDLLDRELITEEQAFDHPRKNEINLGVGPVFHKDWQLNIACFSARNDWNQNIPLFTDTVFNEKIKVAEAYAAQELFEEATLAYRQLLSEKSAAEPGVSEFIHTRIQAMGALTRCPQQLYMHFFDDEPMPGCRYLLCTDGVNDILRDTEIHALMTGPDYANNAKKLIKALKSKGLKDNTSFIVVEILNTSGGDV